MSYRQHLGMSINQSPQVDVDLFILDWPIPIPILKERRRNETRPVFFGPDLKELGPITDATLSQSEDEDGENRKLIPTPQPKTCLRPTDDLIRTQSLLFRQG